MIVPEVGMALPQKSLYPIAAGSAMTEVTYCPSPAVSAAEPAMTRGSERSVDMIGYGSDVTPFT